MDVSVVIPVFNSEGTVHAVVDEVRSVVEACAEHFEVILVDDGSADGSWKEAQRLAEVLPEVRAIRLARNFGEQNAVLCGIRAARFDVVVTIDDDLQQPPSEIPALLGALTDDVDLVYGVADRYGHRARRRATTAIAKAALEWVFRIPRATDTTSFRAFRTDLRRSFEGSPGPMFTVDGLLAPSTTRVATVRVSHVARGSGRSTYTFPKLVSHWINMITSSSPAPLLFASVLGVLCGAAAVIGAGWAVVDAAAGDGSSTAELALASVAAGLCGAMFLAMGILGQYAARILMQLSGRPPYVVDERAGSDD